MKVHPECKSDEVFLTNDDDLGVSQIGWKSKRKGRNAYDIDGNLIKGLFPVFVKQSELPFDGLQSLLKVS